MFNRIFQGKIRDDKPLSWNSRRKIGKAREKSMPGDAFTSGKQQNTAGPRKKRGPVYIRFCKAGLPGYIEQIRDYARHIPLLVRDLDFQFHFAKNSGGTEDSLEAFAITAHGIKFSSRSIMAEETGKRAGELEEAAIMGDMDFLREKMPKFLDYMDYFIQGLEQFLERGKGLPLGLK